MSNLTPEQEARDTIDRMLKASGWSVMQKTVMQKTAIDFNAGEGQAVREYHTGTGPADYVLFVDGKPVGVIDAALKRSEALRQFILKKAFTGQLVPQDPTDEPASVLLERIREERKIEAPSRKSRQKVARKRASKA